MGTRAAGAPLFLLVTIFSEFCQEKTEAVRKENVWPGFGVVGGRIVCCDCLACCFRISLTT